MNYPGELEVEQAMLETAQAVIRMQAKIIEGLLREFEGRVSRLERSEIVLRFGAH